METEIMETVVCIIAASLALGFSMLLYKKLKRTNF